MRNFMKIVEENSKKQFNELFKGTPYPVKFHAGANGPVARFSSKNGEKEEKAVESKSHNMRDIMNIYEAGLFPDAPRMIRIDPNVYKLMRALLFIANPEAYENNSNHDDAGMMVFGDEITYKETTEKLKSFGIPFKDDTVKDVKTVDGELMPDKEGQISPYPNNKAKKIKKKTITPNPFKHNS